jgi:hypothetical protein
MDASLKEMKAEIRANNEKFEVLQGTLFSRMDAYHAKTEANHEEMTKLDAHYEMMRASVNAW